MNVPTPGTGSGRNYLNSSWTVSTFGGIDTGPTDKTVTSLKGTVPVRGFITIVLSNTNVLTPLKPY